jgi:FlaA1/EpsC-like NDP-sugar epimerase
MTVAEAAQLVVQAGAMATGGEIFLLDMGEPVRIYQLARMMIQLSGLSATGDDGREGDIEIVEIGLRPGEKLHEELLIDKRALPTTHPRIVKASEPDVLRGAFERMFAELLRSMDRRDAKASLDIIGQLVLPEATNGAAMSSGPEERREPDAAGLIDPSSDIVSSSAVRT